ncbi:DUF502 domain-containing protein [Halodesulfovibrio aestuarii]|uniref:DUF502 domain-containing protein n=1 Tax=Halodesulfovibrio aestuarii TaxID=126333 RepID=UPI003521EF04
MTATPRKRTLWQHIKYFLRVNLIAGFLFLAPIVVTVFILRTLLKWADSAWKWIPDSMRVLEYLGIPETGTGIILVFIILVFTGLLVRNYVGKIIARTIEKIILKLPGINRFYAATNQLFISVFKSPAKEFKQVVLIEYPRHRLYALAFVTGIAVGEIQRKTEEEVLNVFVPTTPNPTSGFYLMVPQEDTIKLDISVEDAFKILISGGILNPESPELRPRKNSITTTSSD